MLGETLGEALGEEVGEILGEALGEILGEALGFTWAGSAFFFSPKMLGLPSSNTPAIQAIIKVANVPTNKAFQPKSEISRRREGIKAIVPPTKIPTDARWAKPDRA